MPDVTFVHPGAQQEIYGPELARDLTAIEPPTWARMIAGYIRDRGFSISIIDADAEGLDAKAITARILHNVPSLVVIVVSGQQPSASTQQMVGASAAAKMIKAYMPNVPIMMAGNHPSALPERTLREEAIDFVCDGEGPITIEAFLRRDTPYASIPGLVWWFKDEVVKNPTAPLIDDLAKDLHGDVWDLLPMDRYRAHQWQCFGDLGKRKPYASIYTTLGCPHACSFCMINVFQHTNRYRRFAPEFVVGQIKKLYEQYGVSTIKIADELFILSKPHYTAICQGIIDAGLGDKLNMWAYARVDTVHPENLDLLRRAGIRWLALGIESGSKHVRDGTDKALRNDDIVGVVRAVQAVGINVIGNYIFGLHDDDYATMGATLALAKECNTEFANFYSAMAYPGSKLYDDAIRTGATLPETWAGFSQHSVNSRPLDTEHVGGAEILKFRDEAFLQYFQRPAFLSMIESKFGAETLEHVRQMTTVKLRRKLLEPA